MKRTANFYGLNFSTPPINELVSSLLKENLEKGTAYHFVNSYTLSLADKSSELYKILQNDFLICDGKPLALTLRRRNKELQQVRGADFMRQFLRIDTSKGGHFFLGSSNKVLDQLVLNAKTINPKLKISGHFSPNYSTEFNGEIAKWVSMIRASKASIVWVGLGTPKQDFVSHEIAKSLQVKVFAVGAAFDFLSGSKSEAPKFLQRITLEWAYRLIKEPRRLGRRYVVGNYKFLLILLKEKIASVRN